MKDNYNKSITLKCPTCGDSDFKFNDDKTWVKCNRCNREYSGGYNELVELNESEINEEIESAKNEIAKDLKKDIENMIKNAFKR